MEDLALLEDTVDDLIDNHPDSIVYIRGASNAAVVPRDKNTIDSLLQHFLSLNNLQHVSIGHPTYHHFTNEGKSNSNLDVLLYSKLSSEGFPNTSEERLIKVLCGKTNSLINSSHDLLLSAVSFSGIAIPSSSSDNISAPRISSTKHKIVWSEEGILSYKDILENTLPSLQDDFSGLLLEGSASVLFQITNHLLTSAAKLTNESIDLSKPATERKPFTPRNISDSIKTKDIAHQKVLQVLSNPEASQEECDEAQTNFKAAKAKTQNLVRKHNVDLEIVTHEKFNDILSKHPNLVFKNIKSSKSKQGSKLKSLKVGDKLYTEETVADGFFDSISSLKTLKKITSTHFESFAEDHKNIIEICKNGRHIPRISLKRAESLLKTIKPAVTDFYSISAAHYLNGGPSAILHFQFLINTVLKNIEIASIEEMNTTHAVILHKGHGKDKNISSSYRTISSCPFTAKSVDIYLGQLSKEDWNLVQAETQFQGEGMSHELAALLLTTTVQHSLSLKMPIFVLLVDAMSAFDLVLRQLLVRRLYLDTESDQRVRYWDLRLANRTTYCQWDKELMGPIRDQVGVEQGGPSSSEFYKIYNNEQLSSAQASSLGTFIHNVHVASMGQADDTALASNSTDRLQHLLQLTLNYCAKYQVELSAVKTKLLVFSPPGCDSVKYAKALSPIHIGNKVIPFVDSAEHVGILRSVNGNLPHIHQRIVKHRKALACLLFAGMSRRHRANPLASLRAEKIFGTPVLFSGLASLILKQSEVDIISYHVKQTTQDLLKLHQNTPDVFIFMMAGTLPGEAILHLKQLTLFGMICNLPGNILNQIAQEILLKNTEKDKSWFAQIQSLCFKYNLPHPLLLLADPISKPKFKTLIKTQVVDFWQTLFRRRTTELSSLKYFKPQFMSLLKPHPLLTTAGHSYDINKMIVQLRMLSGRYRVGSLLKHFATTNTGNCELCGLELEDINHLLLPRCPLLFERRQLLLEYSETIFSQSTVCTELFNTIMNSEDDIKVQFFLDCSVLPMVIKENQSDKTVVPLLFKFTRTWCYSLHRTRLKLLNRWST